MRDPTQNPAGPLPFEQGGLPDKARERLATAGKEGFTSTFSVSEMAVARLAGYEPVGQVMGSSVYHVGWRSFLSGWVASSELTQLTHAQAHARRLALGRMEEEARLLGADAVVGTVIEARDVEPEGGLVEFTAFGTAVRTRREGTPPARPALTNLTTQELYKLELAGLWPLGLALGNCVWLDLHCDCIADGNWFNQRMTGHTAVCQNARHLAIGRFREDLAALGAMGAVGVSVQRVLHQREYETNDRSHTEFKADVVILGTAVTRRAPPKLPRPRLVLDLGGRQIDLAAPPAAPAAQGE